MVDRYVTRQEFDNHLEKAEDTEKNGFGRLRRLEAEVMGDEQSGRKSLRLEFTEEQRKTRGTVLMAILLMIVGFVVQYFLSASVMAGKAPQ